MGFKKTIAVYLGKLKEIASSDTVHPDQLGSGVRNGTKYLRDDGTWQEVVATGGTGLSIVTATLTFDFGQEEDEVIQTVASTVLTNTNFKSFTVVPQETTATSLDDFKLNGVTFNIEDIVNNTSFKIRATASKGASGIYTIIYKIGY